MAGDWIKMRVWLARHPKVIAMADFLAVRRDFMDWVTAAAQCHCEETVYRYVTRNVTVSVTVTALLQIWGVANDVGECRCDDLFLPHATLSSLDDIGGVPGIGEAMQSVGWARQDEGQGVTFCNFSTYNVPADDRNRSKNADRQRRYRQNHSNGALRDSNVTRNVTMSRQRREEKRREDIDTPDGVSPPISPPRIEYDDAFETWWETYPPQRRVAKKAAYPKWQRAVKQLRARGGLTRQQAIERLQAACAAFAASPKGKGDFCPHPATWLNQGRYDDDPKAWEETKHDQRPRVGAGQRFDPDARPTRL